MDTGSTFSTKAQFANLDNVSPEDLAVLKRAQSLSCSPTCVSALPACLPVQPPTDRPLQHCDPAPEHLYGSGRLPPEGTDMTPVEVTGAPADCGVPSMASGSQGVAMPFHPHMPPLHHMVPVTCVQSASHLYPPFRSAYHYPLLLNSYYIPRNASYPPHYHPAAYTPHLQPPPALQTAPPAPPPSVTASSPLYGCEMGAPVDGDAGRHRCLANGDLKQMTPQLATGAPLIMPPAYPPLPPSYFFPYPLVPHPADPLHFLPASDYPSSAPPPPPPSVPSELCRDPSFEPYGRDSADCSTMSGSSCGDCAVVSANTTLPHTPPSSVSAARHSVCLTEQQQHSLTALHCEHQSSAPHPLCHPSSPCPPVAESDDVTAPPPPAAAVTGGPAAAAAAAADNDDDDDSTDSCAAAAVQPPDTVSSVASGEQVQQEEEEPQATRPVLQIGTLVYTDSRPLLDISFLCDSSLVSHAQRSAPSTPTLSPAAVCDSLVEVGAGFRVGDVVISGYQRPVANVLPSGTGAQSCGSSDALLSFPVTYVTGSTAALPLSVASIEGHCPAAVGDVSSPAAAAAAAATCSSSTPLVSSSTVSVPGICTGGSGAVATTSLRAPSADVSSRASVVSSVSRPPKCAAAISHTPVSAQPASVVCPSSAPSVASSSKATAAVPATVSVGLSTVSSSSCAAVADSGTLLKSWASLFRGSAVTTESSPLASQVKSNHVNHATPALDANSQRLASLKEVLCRFEPCFQPLSLLPRGFTNTSNWCYVNCILQALLACAPFCHLIRSLPPLPPASAAATQSRTPLLDAMVRLVNEFVVQEVDEPVAGVTSRDRVTRRDRRPPLSCASALCVDYMYRALTGGASCQMTGGRQEDAEELLTCLLSGLQDEMTLLLQDESADHDTDQDDDSNENWQTIVGRNRGQVTRLAELAVTPISRIFAGQLRSSLYRPGCKTTASVQSFFSLQLDIQSDDVKSVRDALACLSRRDVVDGVCCAVTGRPVTAHQQAQLEQLPPVLILHLKRFLFDPAADSVQKLLKPVRFPPELKLDKELVSGSGRGHGLYRLFAVVCHRGELSSKGHYICYTLQQQQRRWCLLDDSFVSPVAEAAVLQPKPPLVPYILFYQRKH